VLKKNNFILNKTKKEMRMNRYMIVAISLLLTIFGSAQIVACGGNHSNHGGHHGSHGGHHQGQ